MESFSGAADWGIAIGVLFYIVRELIKIIQGQLAKKNGGNGRDDTTHDMVKDLWEWHNIKDREGVFIWYVRPSLAEAITSLSENIREQTKILEQISRMQQETLDHIKK